MAKPGSYDDKEHCPKCGELEHDLKYFWAETMVFPDQEINIPEYLRVVCKCCCFDWLRYPKE